MTSPAFAPHLPLITPMEDLLMMEGLHDDTRLLITLAIAAQTTGTLPDLSAIPGAPLPPPRDHNPPGLTIPTGRATFHS